jgi:hypothetical protein
MLLSAGLVIASFFPGVMGSDTIWFIRQAKAGKYDDWLAPILAALWHRGFLLGLGPGWVLIGTVVLFIAALYFLVRPWMSRLAAAVVASVLPLLPPFFGWLGALARDTWYLAFFVASFGFAVRGLRPGISNRRRWFLAALSVAMSWLALASRQNGVLPLLVSLVPPLMVVFPTLRRRWMSRRFLWAHRGWVAVTSWLLLVVLVVGSQQALLPVLNVQRLHPEQATMINDLAALSIREGKVLFSPKVFPAQSLEVLRQQSSVYDIDPLVYPVDAGIKIPLLGSAYEQLRRDWLSALRAHPVGYLADRWKLWMRQLAIDGNPMSVVNGSSIPNSLGYRITFPSLNSIAVDYQQFFSNEQGHTDPFLKIWPYLLATVAGVVWFLRRHQRDGAVLALMGVSSLLYAASIFFGATSLQYRFSLPCMAIGAVLTICLVADALQVRRVRRVTVLVRVEPVDAPPSVVGAPV